MLHLIKKSKHLYRVMAKLNDFMEMQKRIDESMLYLNNLIMGIDQEEALRNQYPFLQWNERYARIK